MRNILFRGRDHTHKWHEGSLIFINIKNTSRKGAAPYEVCYIKGQNYAYEVNPKTIGQLAFPATKIHPDIWEGDIIEDKDGYRMVVKFEPYIHAFNVIVRSKFRGISFENLDEGYLHFRFKNHGAKVIGNIHDNPELISVLNIKATKKV